MTTATDPHNLQRFVEAQASVYDSALAELRSGLKRGHWMWFIFPQVEGLGFSSLSRRYAIRSIEEARAYLAHPILGPRLRECVQAVLDVREKSLDEIFGPIDSVKFRSSTTLFARAAEDSAIFMTALQRYCPDGLDPKTLERL